MNADQELVEAYAAQSGVLAKALEGLTSTELDAHPVPGTWSVREIVLHTMDSDLIASHRMKRIIAEETPLLISYDENAFVTAGLYVGADAGLAGELFDLNRRQTAEILRRLPPAAFDRFGIHSQSGRVTLRDNVQKYVQHVRHHLKFLIEKRAMLGKPLTIAVP